MFTIQQLLDYFEINVDLEKKYLEVEVDGNVDDYVQMESGNIILEHPELLERFNLTKEEVMEMEKQITRLDFGTPNQFEVGSKKIHICIDGDRTDMSVSVRIVPENAGTDIKTIITYKYNDELWGEEGETIYEVL